MGGIGVVNVAPRTKMGDRVYRLRKFQTEGEPYGPVTIVIPAGFGIKLAISSNTTLIAEYGYRWSNSDYLDDVSTAYPSISDQESQRYQLSYRNIELGHSKNPGDKRGNPGQKDGYLILGFRLEYLISKFLKN